MPIFEIQGQDGSIFEVDAPDEVTAAEAFKRFSSDAPPAPRASSPMDALSGVGGLAGPKKGSLGTNANYLGQQMLGAAADIAGAPSDLATLAANAGLWGVDKAAEMFGGNMDYRAESPLGSEVISDLSSRAFEGLGGHVVTPEEVSPNMRMLGSGLRFGTGAAVGGAGLASKTARVAAEAAPGMIQRFARPLVAPYAKSAAPIVGDAVAGAGSGLAVGAYDEYAPEGVKEALGPIGPIASALAGGSVGAGVNAAGHGLVDAMANVTKDVFLGKGDRLTPFDPRTGKREFTRSEMDQAARAVQSQASDPRAAADTLQRNVGQLAPGVQRSEMPTSGALSEDPGLALLEKEARARDPKRFLEQDQRTTAKAGRIVRSVAPPEADARDFTNTADQLQRERETGARDALGTARQAEAALDALRRADGVPIAAAAGQGVDASQKLDRLVVDGSLRPMQERKNRAFYAIDPERIEVRDASPLIQAAQDIRARLGRLNDPNSVLPVRTLDRIESLAVEAGGDGTIPFGEINAIRPELSSAIAKAQAGGDYALADNIRALQVAVNRETDRLAGEATPAGKRAAEAGRIYTQEFAPTWNVGPGDEATKFRRDFNSDRDARTKSAPSATGGRFLQAGQPEKAASLQRIIATTPDPTAAQAEARRFLISDLAESGVTDPSGHVRPDAVRRWLHRWSGTIDTVPGVRAELDHLLSRSSIAEVDASRLAKDVRAAEANLDDVVRNKGALGLVLGKDPVRAVEAVFNSGDPERAMAAIKSEIGTNKRATTGLQAAVIDYVTNQTTRAAVQKTADGSRPVDFERLEDLFNRNERALAKVFSAEEMNTLRQAHRLLKPQVAIKQPGSMSTRHDSAGADQAWRLLEGGLKAKYGVLKGGGVMRTIRIFAESLPNSDKAVRDIIVRMHFDPELAGHLLTRPLKDIDGPSWNKKLNRYLTLATGGRDGEDDADATPAR